MTQEDKDLLFKDLCARLPYGVKMVVIDKTLNADYPDILGIDILIPRNKYEDYRFESGDWIIYLDDAKPCLRPMSSMTKEEENEFISLNAIPSPCQLPNHTRMSWYSNATMLDWLNSHHFDYRGLIEKGLALEAPDGMY